MIETKSTFFELDSGIRRAVKFGDGSVVEIEGCNTICSSAREASTTS